MKKYAFTAFLFLVLSAVSRLTPIHASSPSPTPDSSPATGSAVDINQVTENLKKRLQETLAEAADSSDSASLRAYIGTVKDVVNNTIVIDTKDGKKNIATKDATTIVRSPGNAAIKLSSVRIEDSIIAIGAPSAEDELSGNRVIVSSDAIIPPAKSTGFGTIQKLTKDSFTLSTVSGESKTITYDKKTVVKSPAKLLDLTDLNEGDTVVYTADIEKDSSEAATIVMIVTPSVAPAPSAKASPSAKLKSSPKPSPTSGI